MLNSLDFIVLSFLVLAALSVLATVLMFLIRNKIARMIFFYHTVALGLVAAFIGVSIGGIYFPMQSMMGILMGSVSVAALVVQLVMRKNNTVFLIARIAAAAALVIGIVNAFLI